jgi:hypothetical protein
MRQLIENSLVRQHYAEILNIRLADGVMLSAVNGNSDAQPPQLPHDRRQQTQTSMYQRLTYFKHMHPAIHPHPLTLELLSCCTSFRQHEQTQASIQQ